MTKTTPGNFMGEFRSLGHWDFEFVWDLEFGSWDLQFAAWDLAAGTDLNEATSLGRHKVNL
jgi:hypothetical protein